MSDRRTYERVSHELLMYVDDLDEAFPTKDLSIGGCSLIVPESSKHFSYFQEGKEVSLEFDLPQEGKTVRTKGIVKYVKNGKIGIEFKDISPFKKIYIKYLESLRPYYYTKAFFGGIRQRFRPKEEQVEKRGFQIGKFLEGLKTAGWVIFFIIFFGSSLMNKAQNYSRERILKEIEQERNSKAITLIHRMETLGFFGFPVKKYIQVEDAEAILRAIREVPDDKPIDLIVHTPGGVLLPAFQIAKALKDHKGKVTVFVPHYAMSGGTLIALAADEIVMDKNAVLGPVDPQFMMGKGKTVAAVSVLQLPQRKKWDSLSDESIMLIDQAEKAVKQVRNMVRYLLSCNPNICIKDPDKIVNRLVEGEVTHDYPVFYSEAKNKLGLPVSTDMPTKIYKLMELYKSASTSVAYSKQSLDEAWTNYGVLF